MNQEIENNIAYCLEASSIRLFMNAFESITEEDCSIYVDHYAFVEDEDNYFMQLSANLRSERSTLEASRDFTVSELYEFLTSNEMKLEYTEKILFSEDDLLEFTKNLV